MSMDGKILFWLDGHYSGKGTAIGKGATPILEELESIKNSKVNDAVILIDDIRCFQKIKVPRKIKSLTGYPTVHEVEKLIFSINKDYQFEIFGDTAIAYLKKENVNL